MAPIFSEKLVDPFAVPNKPAMIEPIPSIKNPRLIAWTGGGGAPTANQ